MLPIMFLVGVLHRMGEVRGVHQLSPAPGAQIKVSFSQLVPQVEGGGELVASPFLINF